MILGAVIIALAVGLIFTSPNTAFNPFPPATPAPTILVPSPTSTTAVLPPTWTAIPENATAQATIEPRTTATAIPTRTPFVLPSLTKIPVLIMPTNVRIPLEGRCKVIDQNPADGARQKYGTEFRASWTLQNTGDASWESSEADVRFKEGKAMQTGPAAVDLPQTVPVGSTTIITITMKTPETLGYHIAYWTITAGDKSLCTFYIEIFADK